MPKNGPEIDTVRIYLASSEILDGRNPIKDRGAIMVTLEGTVSAILLMVMGGDHKKAAAMLNEGLLEGVERRLAHSAQQKQR